MAFVRESRPYDSAYDPIYNDSRIHTRSVPGYRTALQITDPNGSDRPLFFAMPAATSVEKKIPEQPPPVVTPREEIDPNEHYDVAVQTMYRESEAQTDPWLPDTTEHTKPRAWFEEEDLEKLDIKERQKLLVALEVEQWAKRDRAIVQLQQQRLNLLVNNFQRREDEEAIKRQSRVEAVLRDRETRRIATVEKIEQKRLKVLRTLTEQRRQMTAKKHMHRDIVAEYANSGSSAYAPLRRMGRPDAKCYMNSAVYGKRDVATDNSLEALDEIEAMYHQTQATPLKTEKTMKRADREHQEYLKTVERSVQEKRGGVEKKVPTLKIAQRIEKPPPRPATPDIKPNVENDEREMAVILLQRLLRGRAMQAEMYRCLENQRQLIRELRTVEALKEAEETSQSPEEKKALEAAKAHEEAAATSEGQVIGEMLSFLNHQLRRRLEERRIDAMMKLAERERRRREAEEAGKREEELARQAVEDEAFRHIMGTNYETAESYLQSIINQSIETAANQLATENARKNAEKITNFTSTAANRGNDETIIARDLVAAFLFPEVEKETMRKRLRIEQKKFRSAAQNTMKSISDKL